MVIDYFNDASGSKVDDWVHGITSQWVSDIAGSKRPKHDIELHGRECIQLRGLVGNRYAVMFQRPV